MYKKQMVFQKIICIFAIIASALVFVYSLGIMTDLYDCLYSTMMDPTDHTSTMVEGSIIYYDMQGFNNTFLHLSLVYLLLGVFLLITNTHVRRRYYIANYLSTGLYCAFDLILCIWAHIQITAFKTQWLTTVNFQELKDFAEMFKSGYTESTFWFDLHYLVFGICLLIAVALIYNLVWKINLMKEEKKLLEGGKA